MNTPISRPELAALLARTVAAFIRSEKENQHYTALLEELDRKGSKLTPSERRVAELLTLLIEGFEERHYALKPATPGGVGRTHGSKWIKTERPPGYFWQSQHRF